MTYDVAIVGAGPSGTYLGAKLAKMGLKTLILEKYSFPRYKPCGGGLTKKAVNLLPEGWQSLVEDEITNIIFTYKMKEPVKIKFDSPVIYTVMRDRLDSWLAETAQKAGAKLLEASPVKYISFSENCFEVTTDSNRFKARYVVGADGPASIVCKKFPYDTEVGFAKALEAEIRVDDKTLQQYRSTIWLEYGLIDHGYSWIFPKKNHLSIGNGTFSKKRIDLKQNLNNFSNAKFPGEFTLIKRQGHPIPYLKGTSGKFQWQKTLLVGDAAGFADPLTGEGIYYALKSAEVAAEVISESAVNDENLNTYTERVSKAILEELLQAKKISQVIYGIPNLIHKIITKNPEVVKKMLNVAYGTETYSSLTNYIKSMPVFKLGLGQI